MVKMKQTTKEKVKPIKQLCNVCNIRYTLNRDLICHFCRVKFKGSGKE